MLNSRADVLFILNVSKEELYVVLAMSVMMKHNRVVKKVFFRSFIIQCVLVTFSISVCGSPNKDTQGRLAVLLENACTLVKYLKCFEL